MRLMLGDFSQRFITSFLGFIFTLILVRYVDTAFLSDYFIAFSISSILIWITDFGFVSLMVKAHALNKHILMKQYFSYKVIFASVGSILLVTFTVGTNLLNSNAFILIALILDIFTDSLIPFRQVSYLWIEGFFIQISKKLCTIILFLGFHYFYGSISYVQFFLIIATPAFYVLVYDILHIRMVFTRLSLSSVRSTFGVWAQSGGTMLSSFDSILLGIFGGRELVNILNLSRKLLVFVTIPASAITTRTLHISTTMNAEKIRVYYKSASKIMIPIIILCLAMAFFCPFILTILFGIVPTHRSILLCRVVLLLAPLGAITSNLNSYMLGYGLYKKLSISTYSSSAIYLVCLCLGGVFGEITFWLCAGLVLNTSVELTLQAIFLKAKVKSRF